MSLTAPLAPRLLSIRRYPRSIGVYRLRSPCRLCRPHRASSETLRVSFQPPPPTLMGLPHVRQVLRIILRASTRQTQSKLLSLRSQSNPIGFICHPTSRNPRPAFAAAEYKIFSTPATLCLQRVQYSLQRLATTSRTNHLPDRATRATYCNAKTLQRLSAAYADCELRAIFIDVFRA